ncbi:Hypothetical predicted protein, partial [Marmota monax]
VCNNFPALIDYLPGNHKKIIKNLTEMKQYFWGENKRTPKILGYEQSLGLH